MFVDQKFFIGVQDCGRGGFITNRALLEDMSDTANVHGIRVGQTVERLSDMHLAWVITHWKLEVIRRVKYANDITIRTWSRAYNPVFAYRDFYVFDSDSQIIAKATSVWMMLNTQRNFPQRIDKNLMEEYATEPHESAFPGFQFDNTYPHELKPINSVCFSAPKSMIDYNRHVHNSSYLDIALEVLPEQYDGTSFDNVEIDYKKEVKPSDRIRLNYCEDGKTKYVLLYNEDKSILHTVIKLY